MKKFKKILSMGMTLLVLASAFLISVANAAEIVVNEKKGETVSAPFQYYEVDIKGEVDTHESKESIGNLGNLGNVEKQDNTIVFIVLGILAVSGIGILITIENFKR